MARLWSTGFEENSTSIEFDIASTTNSLIQSVIARTGTYSFKVPSLSSGVEELLGFQFAAANGNGPYFFRAYFRVDTAPSADNSIIMADTDFLVGLTKGKILIKLASDRTLKLFDEDGQIGSASSALTLATWYYIELQFDTTAAAGSHVIKAQLNGTQFAGATNRDISAGIKAFYFGANLRVEAQTTGVWYFDDMAVNDNTGASQTTYPGVGQIIHLRPSAAGDNNGFTVQVGGTVGAANNFTRVSEVTPNDSTSYNADTIGNDTDDFNIDNTPVSIGASDTINVVQVGLRYSALVAVAESSLKARIKKAASGTVSKSAAITPTSVSWTTNANASPKLFPITLYQDPDSSNWTKATLDTAQIGYEISTGNTNASAVSAIWLLVDSTPVAVAAVESAGQSGGQPLLFS